MQNTSTQRKTFYQVLTQKIRMLILVVSFVPMILCTGVLFYRFNTTYTHKIQDHIFELVQKHTLNIDAFLLERLKNIRYLAMLFEYYHSEPREFLQDSLEQLHREYQDIFTDLGLVNEKGHSVCL